MINIIHHNAIKRCIFHCTLIKCTIHNFSLRNLPCSIISIKYDFLKYYYLFCDFNAASNTRQIKNVTAWKFYSYIDVIIIHHEWIVPSSLSKICVVTKWTILFSHVSPIHIPVTRGNKLEQITLTASVTLRKKVGDIQCNYPIIW